MTDLVWHGGILEDGSLWLAPLLTVLGETLSSPHYYTRLRERLERPATIDLLHTLGWAAIEWTPGTLSYPALNGSTPLPPWEAVQNFLGDPTVSDKVRAQVKRQYEKATHAPMQKTFKTLLLQVPAHPGSGIAPALLTRAHDDMPLTPTLKALLETWLHLCHVLREAEGTEQWVVWSRGEISQMVSWDFYRHLERRTPLHTKRTWSAYVRSRAKAEEFVTGFVTDPSGRMDDLALRDLAESHFPFDFNDQAPRPQDVPSWCLLPHLQGTDVELFVDTVLEIAGHQTVTLGPTRQDTQSRDFMSDPLPAMHAQWTAQERDPVLKWAFHTLLEWAHDRRLYHDVRLTPAALALAVARRTDPSSLLQILWGHSDARSLDSEPTILRSRIFDAPPEPSPVGSPLRVRLEPALMQPSCAATRAASRAKKFPTMETRYLTLRTWQKSLPEETTLVASPDTPLTRIRVPQLRAWQAAEYLWLLSTQPDLFCNTQILGQGQIMVAEDHPDLVALTQTGSERPTVSSKLTLRDAYDLFAWSTTMTPWPTLEPSQALQQKAETAPIAVIESGFSAPDIRIALRFESHAGRAMDTLVQSVQALLQETKRQAKVHDHAAKAQQVAAFLRDFGQNLTFETTSYFLINQKEIAEDLWFAAKKVGKDLYVLPDGTQIPAAAYHAFTDRFVARKRVLAKYRTVHLQDLWTVHRHAVRDEAQALSPRAYLEQVSVKLAPVLLQLDAALLEDVTQKLIAPALGAASIRLRPYQLRGIAWMFQRLQLGLGVCLADEMGLGKTAQAIGLIALVREPGKPALVVVPKSLLINWQRELHAFAPHLHVGVYPASGLNVDLDVIVTTYARLRLKSADLSSQPWGVVVLDEAQNIKNSDSQTSAAARSLITSRRVALTGTPVENHAGEIWSLIDWLNPGYLGSQTDFTSFVQVARSATEKHLMLGPLRECLAPLLLRRLKEDPDVALSLPPKIFETLTTRLSPEQELLYRSVLDVVLSAEDDSTTAFVRRAAYLKAILHLKQICNHPEVFYGNQTEEDVLATIDEASPGLASRLRQVVRTQLRQEAHHKARQGAEDLASRSGKFAVFRDLVGALKDQSRGILVFTQYRATAALLTKMLQATGEPAWRAIPFLHGDLSPKERQELVDDFTAECTQRSAARKAGLWGACPILLLSLKAGGTGLNLTTADRVIHFDRWWNPAVEDQATDRAHRFGQTKTVFVYNLINEDTIESAVSQIFATKRSLAQDFLGGEGAHGVADALRDKTGFLDLVDPACRFVLRDTHLAP